MRDALLRAEDTQRKEDIEESRELAIQYLLPTGDEDEADEGRVQLYTPVYAAAQLLYAQSCYWAADQPAKEECHSNSSNPLEQNMKNMKNNKRKRDGPIAKEEENRKKSLEAIQECLRAVDLAVLRTDIAEWGQIASGLLHAAEHLRSKIMLSSQSEEEDISVDNVEVCGGSSGRSKVPEYFMRDSHNGTEIPRVDAEKISVSMFLNTYLETATPVILTNAMTHWPALQKWRDLNYFKKLAAERLVPVETYAKEDSTQTYLTKSWEREVLPLSEFIDKYLSEASSPSDNCAYLAQYQLFDQIPTLLNDIEIPKYCSARTQMDNEAPDNSECSPPALPLVSAWFGPKATVSPLHNDPYHNLLAQVVGCKYLRLYDICETDKLYPRSGPMCNNSHIDLDSVLQTQTAGNEKFPQFFSARFCYCVLQPGEMLYIPRHFWHYVRSLDTSFSTSFWWGAKMALGRDEGTDKYCSQF